MARKYLGTGLQGAADVGLATALAARHVAVTVGAILTSGYASAGKGAGHYVSDALATAGLAAAHPRFCKQSADGRYWRLLPEPWIAVTQGGAIGDGASDDYAAIQAAITYGLTFGGATVYFPAATYFVSASPQITEAKGLNLKGEGADRSIIAAGNYPAMQTLGWWRSTCEGLEFRCNANTVGGAFQMEGKPDGTFGVQGIVFTLCLFNGSYNSKYVFTNQRIAGGSGQGSECIWTACSFVGAGHNAGDALFLNNGANAVQNALIECNLQGFLTGVKITAGSIDILHTGFQSTYGYEQIALDGWDVDASYSSQGDTITMTGCRSESLRIYRGGGQLASISSFAHQQGAASGWGTRPWLADELVVGRTAAGNDKLYRVTTAGTNGAAQPVWPESGTVADGAVVWTQTDFAVFQNVSGLIARGQMQLGQFFGTGSNVTVEDVWVTRDDCFSYADGYGGISGSGPKLNNVRLGGAPPPGSISRPVKIGNNNNAGARNTNPHFVSLGEQSLVWTEGAGGGTHNDISIGRGQGSYGAKALNWLQFLGGIGFERLTYAQLTVGGLVPSQPGVVYFVTDGTPGSSPLTSGGTGCLAVRQDAAWHALAMGGLADDAVTNAKLANMAVGTIKGRASAGTGDPEDLSAGQVRSLLNVADGASANSADAALLARANHTGTQAAATISGLAAIATSGSAADLAGTVSVNRFNGGTGASAATWLRGDGTWVSPAGTGDVTGPASSSDNGVPRFDLATGKLLQGSRMAVDDDGVISSATNSGANAVRVPLVNWIRQAADYTLTSSTVYQKIFNQTSNGALTLPPGTYEFDCILYVTGMSATSGNLTFSPLGSGTASTAGFMYQSVGVDNTSPLNVVALGGIGSVTANSATAVALGTTGTGLFARLSGMFKVTAAGTIIPSVALQTAAAALVKAGSWFRIAKIGENADNAIGAWT